VTLPITWRPTYDELVAALASPSVGATNKALGAGYAATLWSSGLAFDALVPGIDPIEQARFDNAVVDVAQRVTGENNALRLHAVELWQQLEAALRIAAIQVGHSSWVPPFLADPDGAGPKDGTAPQVKSDFTTPRTCSTPLTDDQIGELGSLFVEIVQVPGATSNGFFLSTLRPLYSEFTGVARGAGTVSRTWSPRYGDAVSHPQPPSQKGTEASRAAAATALNAALANATLMISIIEGS